PLDMRMSQEGQSAADVVNTMKEKELADILYLYGEERASYRIASAIVKARQKAPITRTLELAEIVHHVMPRPKKKEIDSATRTFQALRIYVNKELQDLETLLSSSLEALKPNGRLCVVSFHSLEDRIVKTFMVKNSREYEATSRYLPLKEKKQAFLRLINKKPILPGAEELSSNSRSHSAKLRVAERRADE
ncbi:MAG: 16S rRNA (cytosine(1402)-N(4))-methyltransferase RsmH, partial [Alphaproteobacteria bacterium]|nr:16S rRNA (cytosine(1402)-N(4))-methyltransferase RsmH [Alphaproteobacteria bacterium]